MTALFATSADREKVKTAGFTGFLRLHLHFIGAVIFQDSPKLHVRRAITHIFCRASRTRAFTSRRSPARPSLNAGIYVHIFCAGRRPCPTQRLKAFDPAALKAERVSDNAVDPANGQLSMVLIRPKIHPRISRLSKNRSPSIDGLLTP